MKALLLTDEEYNRVMDRAGDAEDDAIIAADVIEVGEPARNDAYATFVDQVLAWCERTGSDVLSTFDITDDVWERIRP